MDKVLKGEEEEDIKARVWQKWEEQILQIKNKSYDPKKD
ncbi:unnamed protein product, partial [marine sediment metagenome]